MMKDGDTNYQNMVDELLELAKLYGEYEKKIGFSLNLNEKDIAIAVAVWKNRQMYRK